MDRLKQVIIGFVEELGLPLSKSGKKQELIDKVTAELDKIRYMHDTERYKIAQNVLSNVRTNGMCVILK